METSHTLRKDHRSLSVQLDEFSHASLICGTSSQSKHRLSQPPKDLWILFPSCNLLPQNTHCIFSECKLVLSFQIFILATCISIIYTWNSFNLFIQFHPSTHWDPFTKLWSLARHLTALKFRMFWSFKLSFFFLICMHWNMLFSCFLVHDYMIFDTGVD